MPKKKVVEVEETSAPVKPVQSGYPYSLLPIPGSPPESLREGEGKAELGRKTPEIQIGMMSNGAFMYLWRLMEAKAWQFHSHPTLKLTLPEQLTVANELVELCRQAGGTIIPGMERAAQEHTEASPPRKAFKAPPKKPAPPAEAPPQRKMFKRPS